MNLKGKENKTSITQGSILTNSSFNLHIMFKILSQVLKPETILFLTQNQLLGKSKVWSL